MAPSITHQRRTAAARQCMSLAILCLLLSSCHVFLWSVEHEDADMLAAGRPECVNHWQRSPLYFDSASLRKARSQLQDKKIRGVTLTPDVRVFEHPIPTQADEPSGPVGNVAGPPADGSRPDLGLAVQSQAES